jgi:hypothetical protein
MMSDAMEHDIKRGDYVVIDMANRTPIDGGVFAIDNGGYGLTLKRIRINEYGTLVAQSDRDDADQARPIDPERLAARTILHIRVL